MAKIEIEYEVFVDSVHGSDVVKFDNFKDARKCAEDWAKTAGDPVVVTRVQREIVMEVTDK